jgi:beta-glucanase (GH16 family)
MMARRKVTGFIRHGEIVLAVAALLTSSACGVAHPGPDEGLNLSSIIATHTLYAADEFTGAVNQPPDPKFWNIETGGNGWGDHELQTYTADARNIRQDGQGHLVLEADDQGGNITSARLNTQGKVELTNGLIAARIKMPAGQGLHSSFWMLGSSLDKAGYPACGEIDIVEITNDGTKGSLTIHGPAGGGAAGPQSEWQLELGKLSADLADNFHTYWLFKQPGKLTVGFDERPVTTINAGDVREGARWVHDQPQSHRMAGGLVRDDNVPGGAQWVFDQPFFALLSLAVGGDYAGPLGSGVLPKQMTVDWVRFYR